MHKKYIIINPTLLIIFCFIGWIFSFNANASGAFSPFSGGFGSEQFNKGKAIYSGRAGNKACISCHKKFRRSKLRKLEISVAELVSNCDLHNPCYEKFTVDQKVSLNAYFNRRYHLK